jgi:hypothetical protein
VNCAAQRQAPLLCNHGMDVPAFLLDCSSGYSLSAGCPVPTGGTMQLRRAAAAVCHCKGNKYLLHSNTGAGPLTGISCMAAGVGRCDEGCQGGLDKLKLGGPGWSTPPSYHEPACLLVLQLEGGCWPSTPSVCELGDNL